MKTAIRRLTTALMLLFVATSGIAQTRTVDVTVTYRERVALPPDAEIELEIADISRADAPSQQVVYQRTPIQGVPTTFRLAVEEDQIDERFTYSVRGQIYSGDTVIFRSDTVTPVLTRGAPDQVELVLIQAAAVPAGNSISGVNWTVFEIGGRAFIGEDPPTIAFDADGNFGLYGGCNRFTGTATIGDGTISFPEAFAGTRRACAPPRDSLEQSMLEVTKNATGYVRNDDLLTLTNAAGVPLARFRGGP